MSRRSAYVFLPLVVVLGLSLAVLGFIYGSNAPVKVTPSGSYNSGQKYGALFGGAVFALFMVWRAGRFAERRGAGSANAIFGGILLLANLALGINAYRVTLGSKAGQGTPVAKSGGGGGGAAQGAIQPSQPRPAPAQGTAPLNGGGRPGVAPPGVVPVPASPEESVAPADATPAAPEAINGAPKLGNVPATRPALKEPEQDPKAQPVIDATRARLVESATLSADAAEGLMKIVERPPAHDKRVLKSRAEDAEVLRGQLTKTAAAMREARDAVEKELIAVGVDRFEASRLSTGFTIEFDTHSKAFACERLLMLCDHVRDECAVLDQNFAAWSLVKGEIAVRDAKNSKLRHELTKERFFIESGCKQSPEVVKTLRGP